MSLPVAQGAGAVLITGGAGFVGSNLAADLLRRGYRVRIVDDLSRPGVEDNLTWLQRQFGGHLECHVEDLLTHRQLDELLVGVDVVYHFAAQVAVTTSLENPLLDFRNNLQSTFRLLEAVRRRSVPPALVFASTNKVYGNLAALPLTEEARRYRSAGREAVDEQQPLDFHTPYGCSKGAAEQYVLDYARSFGIRATVLRMSCIYGPRQCGTEDQGWVAHFAIRALAGEPVFVYGNGKQVRDILYVDDLVAAQRAAWEHIDALSGRPWNIGGGAGNSVSVLEVLDLIRRVTSRDIDVRMRPERPGDQKYYVSDCAAFGAITDWRPTVAAPAGVERMVAWLRDRRSDVPASDRSRAAGAH